MAKVRTNLLSPASQASGLGGMIFYQSLLINALSHS